MAITALVTKKPNNWVLYQQDGALHYSAMVRIDLDAVLVGKGP